MKNIKIKDIYAGNPDAKDEIDFEGSESFMKTFVVAGHFNIDSLINDSLFLITGFKGTGKTALLYYLEDKVCEYDSSTCSSFVFFKEEFPGCKRDELQKLSQRILSSITVDESTLLEEPDFEYIWRWLFFKRIISDNECQNRNLFKDNSDWQKFEATIEKISGIKDKKKLRIPKKLKLAVPCIDKNTNTEIAPEIEVDLQNAFSEHYQEFIELLDEAENYFSRSIKTDIPYYIFVDELEAYYGDKKVFIRDLRMIRDLIITVKWFNTIFNRMHFSKTKIICSLRSEILNAISRFIVPKEINKITNGFSLPLNWNYTNSNSYMHPIIQIVLKRIALSSDRTDDSSLDIYNEWFPENIRGMEPANYILNNSWCKPRDMVRLITTARNSIKNTSTAFTQIVFDTISHPYSQSSLEEIKEELRALYKSDEIDCIINCFTGFKTHFSVNDLRKRVDKYFKGTILDTKFTDILRDLYRLGFLGNFLPVSKEYHWQHKDDHLLILSDEWRLCVHYALHSALALSSRNDYAHTRKQLPQIGDTSTCVVTKLFDTFALAEFELYGEKNLGTIHVSEFRNLIGCYISCLSDYISVGDTFNIVISKYNIKYRQWYLNIVQEKE